MKTGIIFYQKPNIRVGGRYPIYARISNKYQEIDICTNIYLYPTEWDLLNFCAHDEGINNRLYEIEELFFATHKGLKNTGAYFSLKSVAKRFERVLNQEAVASKTDPTDSKIEEIYSAIFSRNPSRQNKPKALSSKQAIKQEVKEKMAKRRLDLLLNT